MSSVWIDAQLSPALAEWLPDVLGMPAYPLRDLGLRDADDAVIFSKAAVEGVIMLTKDADFQLLLNRHGPPPRVISRPGARSADDPGRVEHQLDQGAMIERGQGRRPT